MRHFFFLTSRAPFVRVHRLILTFALLAMASIAHAAPGGLDPSFGGTGEVRTGFGNGSSSANAVAYQSDGKFVLAGYANVTPQITRVALMRFTTNNVLDTTFGNGGRVITFIGATNSVANAVRVQSDGKIIVAGGCDNAIGITDIALARYNLDGTLDSSFGTNGNGIVISRFHNGPANQTINAMILQTDGKIVVGGNFQEIFFNGTSGMLVGRYNTNGVLDSTFGNNGVVEVSPLGGEVAYALMIQSDSKIVAAGSGNSEFFLTRYLTNGILDTTFNGSGYVYTPVGQYYSFFGGYAGAYAVATQFGDQTIQNPDRIVAVGQATVGLGTAGIALVRYNLNGTLDTTFGTGGLVTNSFATESFSQSYGKGVAITGFLAQPRKITVGGYFSSPSSNADYFALARFNANGTFDTTFGTNGKAVYSFTPGGDQAHAMGFLNSQPLLVGYSKVTPSQNVFSAARFTSTGVVDTNFGTRGIVNADTDLAARARAVVVQGDGKVVAVGSAGTVTNSVFALARYNTDGAMDATFGTNGRALFALSAGDSQANAVALQSDGKIVAAGYANITGSNNFALLRCNTNGVLDSTFSGGTVVTNVGTSNAVANAIALQADGKILLAGFGFNGSAQNFAVVRYATNGTLDTGFGGMGKVLTGIGSGGAQANAVKVQPDGKIVVVGQTLVGAVTNFALVRYQSTGSLDSTFGTIGRVTTDFGAGTTSFASAAALQSDNKILAAGGVSIGGTEYIALARYNTNGTLDNSFGANGEVVTQLGPVTDYGTAITLMGNGKILVAGVSLQGSYNQYAIVRYNSDGSVDSTFGNGGTVLLSFNDGGNDLAAGIALDASGRALVAGDASGLFGVARLLADPIPGVLSIFYTPTNTIVVSFPLNGWNLRQATSVPSAGWSAPAETVRNDGTNNFIIVSPPTGNRFFELQAQ